MKFMNTQTRYKTFIHLFFIGALLFLSACQKNKKTQQTSKTWSTINSWSFSGKMAINDGENNGSGRIKWQVINNHKIQAQFKAPLGQGSWDIDENQRQATLISSANGKTTAENAQLLISNELGWHFPWNKLQHWFRGHSSNEPITKINQEKESFIDEDWNITFSKWTNTPLGLLPKKITANKPPYSVKLIIYNWDFE